MDLAELENDYFPPNINRAREDKFFRPRRSPRRKLRAGRVSASLVIDQLKSSFRRPGDLALPRMRGRRNWRLEFLMRHFRNNRCGRDEGRKDCKEAQRRPRKLAPEVPRIYSIGLYSNASTLDDRRGDSASGALRSVLKRRFNIVRRAMIVCKYWTPSLPAIASSIQQGADQRTAAMMHRAVNVPEQAPASHRYFGTKDNEGDCSRDNGAIVETLVDDRFLEFDRNGSSMKDCHVESHVARKDAQIQTLGRTSWRRRRSGWRKSGTSDDQDDESSSRPCDEMFTEVRADARRSRLPVRIPANKHAEYASQLRASSRQETRETRYGDEHSQGNADNDEKGSSLRSDDVKKLTKRKLDENEAPSVPKGKDSMDAKESVTESERQGKSVRQCDESCPVVSRANISIVPPTSRYKNSDILPRERFTPTTTRDETEATDPASKIAGSERRAKCHVVKQICFDLDLTKGQRNQSETEEFSIENESFREIYLRDDLRVLNGNEYAKVPIEKLGDLGGFRLTRVADEKMGERAILVDIKRRIDRDFDDPSADKYDNDVEDFLTMSERSFEHRFYVTPSAKRAGDRTIEKSRSTPLLDRCGPASDTVHDSTSVGTVSDSNRNSNSLSKYFSCTQLSSLISLTENEDELTFAFEDRDMIARDLSCTNLHSDSNYYDLDLTSSIDYLYPDDSSLNDRPYLNRANFHSSEYSTRRDPSYDLSSDRLSIEPIKDDDGDPDGKFYDDEYLAGGIDDTLRGSRGLEWRRTADSTFDSTSKSSRYIGSIDSGVFVNSSLLDLYPQESPAETAKPGAKRKTRRTRGLSESRLVSSSDSDSTDDTLGRKVDDIVRDLTRNLVLCERRARRRLEEMQRNFRAKGGISYSRHTRSRTSKFTKDLPHYDPYYDLFDSARRSSEDERILSISTPSLLSLTDSEIDERESIAKS